MIRAALALSSYLGFTWLLLVMFCLLPGRALALVSPAAYSRVVAQAEWIAYQAATKPAVAQAVATAASATSPASLAIRAVTGPLGWAALGVTVGIALYQTYYSDSQLNEIKSNTNIPGAWGIPGYDPSPYSIQSYQTQQGFGATPIAVLGGWNAGTLNCDQPTPSVPSGWSLFCYFGLGWGLTNGGSGATATKGTATPATADQIQSYVSNLSDSNALSIPSNSAPLGSGASPTPASEVQTVPVSPTDMPTTVKPTSQVSPTDIKVADNVPPPSGAQVTSSATQTSTKTTTTTQNPDGSVTEAEEETTSTSCTMGDHDTRTMRTVFDQHQATWETTGLLQALNLLKTLTWPSTLPVVSLPSSFFGAQQVDFNEWTWVFTALRTVVIAIATLAAYRIVFVGGR